MTANGPGSRREVPFVRGVEVGDLRAEALRHALDGAKRRIEFGLQRARRDLTRTRRVTGARRGDLNGGGIVWIQANNDDDVIVTDLLDACGSFCAGDRSVPREFGCVVVFNHHGVAVGGARGLAEHWDQCGHEGGVGDGRDAVGVVLTRRGDRRGRLGVRVNAGNGDDAIHNRYDAVGRGSSGPIPIFAVIGQRNREAVSSGFRRTEGRNAGRVERGLGHARRALHRIRAARRNGHGLLDVRIEPGHNDRVRVVAFVFDDRCNTWRTVGQSGRPGVLVVVVRDERREAVRRGLGWTERWRQR